MFKIAAGLSAAALLAATPALAGDGPTSDQKFNFSQCDGYQIPSAKADGMTGVSFLWRVNPADDLAAKSYIGYSLSGVKSCNAALADPYLLPQYWRRKVNLLQSRALHQLELGDSKAALADLDLANAAIADANDLYFARSQAVSLGYLRAYSLAAAGDQSGAEAIALNLMAARPYGRLSVFAAYSVIGPGASDKTLEGLEWDMARLQPAEIEDLFNRFAREGRWAELIPLYPQLTTPVFKRRIGAGVWAEDIEVTDLVYSNLGWIERTGVYAYALAAQGRDAEAKAAMVAARTRLEAALVPDKPLRPENNPSQQKIDAAAAKAKKQASLRQKGELALARWNSLVDRRVQISAGDALAVANGLSADPAPRNVVGREFMLALQARLKADPKTPLAVLQSVAALTPPPPPPRPPLSTGLKRPEPRAFREALPLPEAATSMPDYKKAYSGFLGGNEEGFYSFKPDPELAEFYGPDVVSLAFRTLGSNAEVSEEMALLRAADLALQAGKDGLVILYRHDAQIIVNSTYYGQVISSTPSGYSTALNVVFVNKANLPARLKDASWRVIDARRVYDDLAPVYLRPDDEKTAKKKK